MKRRQQEKPKTYGKLIQFKLKNGKHVKVRQTGQFNEMRIGNGNPITIPDSVLEMVRNTKIYSVQAA